VVCRQQYNNRHAAVPLVFRAGRSGGVRIIFDHLSHGHPTPGTGQALPEGRDAAPAGGRATGSGRQARREERRGRQDVPDQIAGQVLERAGQAMGQQVRQPQERQTVVAMMII